MVNKRHLLICKWDSFRCAPLTLQLSSDFHPEKMPWNRDRILAEIDRDQIPKGVEEAILDRPDLGIDNLCFALENGGTVRQKVNAFRLVIRLLSSRKITQDQVIRTLSQIKAHIPDSDRGVSQAACRAAFWYCFMSQVYKHLRMSIDDRRSLFEGAYAAHPELDDDGGAIIEGARKGLGDV